MKQSPEELLNLPVQQLSLSEECKVYLEEEHIVTLQDFIDVGWAGQKNKNSFSLPHFNAVVNFLQDHDLLHLMEGK